MNYKRAIGGFLLSFVFLVFFAYMISGVQWVLSTYPQAQGSDAFLGSISDAAKNIVQENRTESTPQPSPTTVPSVSPAPEINAKSAISVESDLQALGKVIFEKNGDAVLPIASLTKLMTAVIALENYNLSDVIVVDAAADSQSSMKQDVKLGDRLSVESFLDIMLIKSSNKAAYVLAEGPNGQPGQQKFVELMNQKARDLGLKDTYFVDPTGLSSGDVSTASELATLAGYILRNYPKIADISSSEKFIVPGFGEITNTDQLLAEIPEIVCSKTGFTTAANGCLLLVVSNPKGPKGYSDYFINVILGADDRFSEMKKLISYSNSICK